MAMKIASIADLNAIIEHAKHSPAELERLANNPEAVLAARKLTASPGAVEFLRTMGTADYDEAKEAARPVKDAAGGTLGEN